MILAILNLHVATMPPTNPAYCFWRRFCLKIERWPPCRLEYWNRTILAIVNLHVVTMPPTKFQFNLTYGSLGDVQNVKS